MTSNAEYMKRYRKRHPEYVVDQRLRGRAQRLAMQWLRDQYRFEYDCYLEKAISIVINEKRSND
jgi:hypothetical protein